MINSVTVAVIFICIIAAIVAFEEPPTVKGPPKTLIYHLHTSDEREKYFDLKCVASGDPVPTYRWTKNGLPFDETADERVMKLPHEGTLRFDPTVVEDEGYYQCIAENNWGTSLSNVVSLRRFESSTFENQTTVEKYVKKGEPLTLECSKASGYPQPQIFWNIQQNSGALNALANRRITADPNGNLHFASFTEEDVSKNGAKYVCSATSIYKNEYKIGTRYILMFDGPQPEQTPLHEPTLQYKSPDSLTILKGHQFELSCIAGGNPLPEIIWSKDGGDFFSYDKPNKEFNLTNYGKTILFHEAKFEHSGRYKCMASNGEGEALSHEMKVTVLSAPYWINEPMAQTKDEESNVTFVCGAHGKPSVKLEWFRNGVPYNEVPTDPRRILRKIKDTDEEKIEELTIVDLVRSDTAVYQCNASNEYSYVFKDFYLNVLLLPPQFIEKPDEKITLKPGASVTLKCSAYGAPKPIIKWYESSSRIFSGILLPIQEDPRKYTKDGYLYIYNVTTDDSRKYVCEARNRVGKIDFGSRVIVEEIKNDSVIVAPTGMGIHEGTQPFAKTDWFIGMICAIALVIILAIFVCIVKRNRGGNYSVHEKEAALRKDFDREDGGFDEYSKPIYPTSGAPVGSRTSLTSSLKHGDDRDADSMTDYGEDDSSKFGEDGSFIGQYGPQNKRKQSGQSSTGVATFV